MPASSQPSPATTSSRRRSSRSRCRPRRRRSSGCCRCAHPASAAGVLYVYYNLFLSPHAISLQQSAEILLMAILGGASTLTGPIVGAAIITLVKNVVSTYVERWNTLLGVIFVVVIMFMPYGLVPGCTQAC